VIRVENKKNNGKQKVAVVTGSSSGIGYATALKFATNGYFTFATMRDTSKGVQLTRMMEKENLPIKVEQLDISDPDSIKDFMNKTTRIDVLVNNAGYVTFGSLEDLTMKEIQDQLDTNLLGTIRVTQQALPKMRAQSNGVIINISSMTGRFGLPGMSAYVATKFALEGLSESLAYEVEPFGIKVILIEPGPVKTNALDNAVLGRRAGREDSPYSSMLRNFNSTISTLWDRGSGADEVAEMIIQAINQPQPKLRYPVGQDANNWHQMKNSMTDEQFLYYIKNSMADLTNNANLSNNERS
jgi:NAD(P)-dependent dehydrogenase (short-subunit alcohol dehydrogenase family)